MSYGDMKLCSSPQSDKLFTCIRSHTRLSHSCAIWICISIVKGDTIWIFYNKLLQGVRGVYHFEVKKVYNSNSIVGATRGWYIPQAPAPLARGSQMVIDSLSLLLQNKDFPVSLHTFDVKAWIRKACKRLGRGNPSLWVIFEPSYLHFWRLLCIITKIY